MNFETSWRIRVDVWCKLNNERLVVAHCHVLQLTKNLNHYNNNLYKSWNFLFTTFWEKKNKKTRLHTLHAIMKIAILEKKKNQAPYLSLIDDAWLNKKWICLQLQNCSFLGKKGKKNNSNLGSIPLIDPWTCWLTICLQIFEKKKEKRRSFIQCMRLFNCWPWLMHLKGAISSIVSPN